MKEIDRDNMHSTLHIHPEKIEFGGGCQGYCSGGLKNKACGRLDEPCRNLKNADPDFIKHYEMCKKQYVIKKVGAQMTQTNDDLSSIY